jgi:hypothetical protein
MQTTSSNNIFGQQTVLDQTHHGTKSITSFRRNSDFMRPSDYHLKSSGISNKDKENFENRNPVLPPNLPKSSGLVKINLSPDSPAEENSKLNLMVNT